MITQTNIYRNLAFGSLIALLVSKNPFVLFCFPFYPDWRLIFAISFTVLIVTLVKKHNVINDKLINIYCFLNILLFAIYSIYFSTSIYLSQIFVYTIFILLWASFKSYFSFYKIVEIYVYVIVTLAVLGTISFFLAFIFHLSPLFEYVSVDNRMGYFVGLTCTNSLTGSLMRYSGLFDEPGAMAAWGMYAILFNHFVIKSVRIELLLMFCICFTFSLAYFILLLLYLLFFVIKSVKKTLLYTILILSVLSVLYIQKDTDNSLLYTITFKRLEKDETGDYKGDNRSELMDRAYENFMSHPFLGIGAKRFSEGEFMGSNPFTPFARDGIVGTFIMYSFIIYLILRGYRHINLLKCIFIIIVLYAQRPLDINLFTLFSNFLLFDILRKKYLGHGLQ